MTKRQRFVISSLVLGSLLVAGNLALIEWRYWIIGVLSIMCGVMTAWSIWEGWRGVARWTTVLLPMLFGLGAGMFTFLLPDVVPGLLVWNWGVDVGVWVAWGLKSFFWLLFTVSIYFLVSTENIFSVSIIRSIPLVRTAYTSGFLYTLLTAFFVYNAIFSFRMPFYWNAVLVFGVSLPLLVQGLWSARLSDKGMTAPEAAGVIHTDFTKKFIKAKVCGFDDFVGLGGLKAAAEKGKVRMEGKEYVMKDGDVVEFMIGS